MVSPIHAVAYSDETASIGLASPGIGTNTAATHPKVKGSGLGGSAVSINMTGQRTQIAVDLKRLTIQFFLDWSRITEVLFLLIPKSKGC